MEQIEEQTNREFDFAMQFLRLEDKQENVIYSPLSLLTALKMLRDGAKGKAKEELDAVIQNIPASNYQNIDSILSFANGLFIRDTYEGCVRKEYKDHLLQKYDANVIYDSFQSAENINGWISDKTFKIITNMMNDSEVQPEIVKMILVNALAIDMEWEHPFCVCDTCGGEFFLENGKSMIATTMSRENVPYYKDEVVTAVSLDLKQYGDTQLEFIGIKPEENLREYMMKFSREKFQDIMNHMVIPSYPYCSHLRIPRFSYQYDLNANDDLDKMGVKEVFCGSADLTNIYDPAVAKEPLSLGGVKHKAKIDFTEKGVKAAAATVIFAIASAMNVERKVEYLSFDKPFLYIIRDKNTKQIWFVGTVYEPNSWDKDKVEHYSTMSY